MTVVYFALGAVMFAPFTPIGRAWVAASGYQSPTSGMSSSNVFYIVPALTAFVSVLATALLVRATGTDTLGEGIVLGLVVGIGCAIVNLGRVCQLSTGAQDAPNGLVARADPPARAR